MPELPEVQTVVDELNNTLSNEMIISIDIINSKYDSEKIKKFCLNQTISNVTRRGKYILIFFENSLNTLVVHLRMTGKFVFSLIEKDKKHLQATLKLKSKMSAYFIDVRKFGTFEIIAKEHLEDRLKLGVEPLTDHLSIEYLKPFLNRIRPIKPFLLDQSYIAGIGNIYADEALFRSRVIPTKACKDLSDLEIISLIDSIKYVLQQSINNMGTTISDYRNTKNIGGENQNYLNVYGQENEECTNCSSKIKRIKMSGRSTYFCTRCQK